MRMNSQVASEIELRAYHQHPGRANKTTHQRSVDILGCGENMMEPGELERSGGKG
jgi:hypothetical protein